MGKQGISLTAEIIKLAWVKLIGEKNFNSLATRINDKGAFHKQRFFPRPYDDNFIVENYNIEKVGEEYWYSPKILTDKGWLLDFSELINMDINFDSDEVEFEERHDVGGISIIPKNIY